MTHALMPMVNITTLPKIRFENILSPTQRIVLTFPHRNALISQL